MDLRITDPSNKHDAWQRSEIYFLIILSLVLMLYEILPLLYGYLMRPAGSIFTWITPINPTDIHVYFAYLREAMGGKITFLDFFTTEPQSIGVLNIFWLALGKIERFIHVSPAAIFHGARLALIPLAVFLIYLWSRLVFSKVFFRMMAVIFAIFGTGWGVYFLESSPMDLYAAEGYPYFTFINSPHFVFSYICYLGTLLLFFYGLTHNKFILSASAGLVALIFFQFHPYYSIPIYLIIFGFSLLLLILGRLSLFQVATHFFLFVFLSITSFYYHAYLTLFDPVNAIRNAQNITLPGPFAVMIVSLGIFFFGLILAAWYLFRAQRVSSAIIFLSCWAIIDFALLWSGLNFSRRFIQGLIIPLSFLIVYLIEQKWALIRPVFKTHPFILVISTVLVFFPTTVPRSFLNFKFYTSLYLHIGSFSSLQLSYIDSDRAAMFVWLRNQKLGSMRILSGEINGNLIPGQTGQISAVGHRGETLNMIEKLREVEEFYRINDSDDRKISLLQDLRITHILFTSLEDNMGDFNPNEKSYLKLVREEGTAKIYSVEYAN